MKISTVMTTITFAGAVALGAYGPMAAAEAEKKPEESAQTMPMMGNQQGGMPCMSMMQRMQQGQGMMPQHMQNMETRLANIEALLKELVELQKKK